MASDRFDDLLGEITSREDIRRSIIEGLKTATGAIVILREPDGTTNVHWIGLDTFMALAMQHHLKLVRDTALDVEDDDE